MIPASWGECVHSFINLFEMKKLVYFILDDKPFWF